MKSECIFLRLFLTSAVLFFLPFYSSSGLSQENPISSIKFHHFEPRPGDTLRLDIELVPSDGKDTVIEIQLITWTDLNADCKYSEPGEEVKHPVIKVKDNQKGKDENSFDNEIRVRIYNVPKDNQPRKYTVIVKFNNYLKSASIIVCSKNGALCDQANTPEEWSFRKLLRLPSEVVEKLRTLKDILKREAEQKKYQGGHGLFAYSLADSTVERIAFSDTALFLSPSWSFDNKKMAVLSNQGEERKVAWLNLEDKSLNIAATGSKDKDPFWLPDNQHILFLRDNRLHVINTKKNEIKSIAEQIRVDGILGVSLGPENTFHVIFEAPNKYTEETKEIYLLEIDSKLNKKEIVHLVNNPVWFLSSVVSPSGEQIVFSERNTLFIESIGVNEKQRLFEDNYNYYEPAWSPDGQRIAFISNQR